MPFTCVCALAGGAVGTSKGLTLVCAHSGQADHVRAVTLHTDPQGDRESTPAATGAVSVAGVASDGQRWIFGGPMLEGARWLRARVTLKFRKYDIYTLFNQVQAMQ